MASGDPAKPEMFAWFTCVLKAALAAAYCCMTLYHVRICLALLLHILIACHVKLAAVHHHC